jgi:ABC-type lipoprotein release transport system permease subunit
MPIEVDISGIWFVFLGVLVSAIASTYGPINKLLNRRIA